MHMYGVSGNMQDMVVVVEAASAKVSEVTGLLAFPMTATRHCPSQSGKFFSCLKFTSYFCVHHIQVAAVDVAASGSTSAA